MILLYLGQPNLTYPPRYSALTFRPWGQVQVWAADGEVRSSCARDTRGPPSKGSHHDEQPVHPSQPPHAGSRRLR